jgi:hypothetical protein
MSLGDMFDTICHWLLFPVENAQVYCSNLLLRLSVIKIDHVVWALNIDTSTRAFVLLGLSPAKSAENDSEGI